MTRTAAGRSVQWLVSLLVLGSLASGAAAQTEMKHSPLQGEMRKLWEEHVSWTRMYIISATADLPDKNATLQRLLKNQADIGNAVRPFYGDTTARKLTELLQAHIRIAGEVLDVASKSDSAKLDAASRRWTANANEIAGFLSGANPLNWPVEGLREMLRRHLELTTQEVTAQLRKDWSGSIAAYDKVREQALVMADALSAGIMKQFPQKVE